MQNTEPGFFQKNSRPLFLAALALSLGLAIYFKLYDVFFWEPFAAIAFCGSMGLMLDWGWKNRKTVYVVLPLLVCLEMIGIMVDKMSYREASAVIFNISSLLYPAFGLIMIRRAVQVWEKYRGTALKFGFLGLMGILCTFYEYRMYLPESAFGWLRYNLPYLAIFGGILLIDFTEKLTDKGLKTEQELLRAGMVVIAIKYFTDFVFI